MSERQLVPRQFHFVFGLRPQMTPFHLAHYLCLESCRQINQPADIVFHCHHEPWGPWWDPIRPHLTIQRIEPEAFVASSRKYLEHAEGRFIRRVGLDYAHQSDFIRLKVLRERGGVYADIDTLFVRPLPNELFDAPFVIGEEDPVTPAGADRAERSLCNALMLSQPGSRFADSWLARMYEVFDGTWSRHSCTEAARLGREMPEEVRVLPSQVFYPCMWTREGLADLFDRHVTLPDNTCSVHLWSHLWWDAWRTDFSAFHAGLLTEEYVRRGETTYAVLARRFLA